MKCEMGLLCTFSLCFAWLAWLIEGGAIGAWRSVRGCKCKCSHAAHRGAVTLDSQRFLCIHTDAIMMRVVQGPWRKCVSWSISCQVFKQIQLVREGVTPGPCRKEQLFSKLLLVLLMDSRFGLSHERNRLGKWTLGDFQWLDMCMD